MISDENKILVSDTLGVCWYFNLTHQQRCQDIFGVLNRIWNQTFFSTEESSESYRAFDRDSVAFRNLVKLILENNET